ncbi:sigma-54 dependent transcriptional regulator [Paraferrimonas sp. SM1919]|uniref:sigma-54-dependent transcriptional regulator n=1 Tax=Paraferrimonas sp. SM1919 TaxID=2662263 RepID=UPI0013D5DA0D|nr:sigma 54-interacting transcriptional regulator [Paraferrimonas sp. SM1919]
MTASSSASVMPLWLQGSSQSIQELRAAITKLANSTLSAVLISEAGCFREKVAACLHELSHVDAPLFSFDCAGLNHDSILNQLFGVEDKINNIEHQGLIAKANGATLFIDNFCQLPLPVQSKFIRLIKYGSYSPVGCFNEYKSQIRIILGSDDVINDALHQGRLLPEFYYLAATIPLRIPSLRERKDDFTFLVKKVLLEITDHNIDVSQELIDHISMLPWYGNYQELQNLLNRLVLLTNKPIISLQDLPREYMLKTLVSCSNDTADFLNNEDLDLLPSVQNHTNNNIVSLLPDDGVNLKDMLAEMEIELIKQALDKQDSVVSRAADMLGVRRTTLVEKMRKYGLGK